MAGIVSLLSVTKDRLMTGAVKKRLRDRVYEVEIAGATSSSGRAVRSSISESLTPGERVVIAETPDGLYIVGKEKGRG